jgi:siroheme synthase-like protein
LEVGIVSVYYPVLLKLDGKRCVVFGDGWGVDRRLGDLLACGAEVTLIAPAVSSDMDRLVEQGRVLWEAREYLPGDLEGAFLAIVCRGDHTPIDRIWAEAESRGVPVNTIDDAPRCTFIFPAIHRQGDLVVAVSSGGKSPALATCIRDRIARELGPEHGELLDLLGQLRPEVIQRFAGFEKRRPIWHALIHCGAIEHLRAGDRAAALAALRAVVEAS